MTSTELATTSPSNVAHGVVVDSGKILSYLGLNPSDPKAQAVVAVCQRYDFDPLLKHVIVIPGSGVYITRDGLLEVAHRSGVLDGIVVEQEPTLSEDGSEYVARVSVYRKDMGHPFTFPGRYPVGGKNREYPQEMALKAAEAHALRRAFSVVGLPTFDERRPDVQPQRGGLAQALAHTSDTPETSGPAEHPDVNPSASEEPAGPEATPLTERTRGAIFALFAEVGITQRERQLAFLADTLGRGFESRADLVEAEGLVVEDRLRRIKAGDPDAEFWEPPTEDGGS